MNALLDTINSPTDVKCLGHCDLARLADELRELMIRVISQNGGHLASSLGAVELAIALHRVFDSPRDKIIWDVGHQAYAHKILTGRRNLFQTIRLYKGLSGFPDRSESEHDAFVGGHAGISISASLGMALARDMTHDEGHVVAVIGDGSMGSGEAFEALNHAAHAGTKLIVVLNDNGMSISPGVGGLDRNLEKVRLSVEECGIGRWMSALFRKIRIPRTRGGKEARMFKAFWNEFGFAYRGPIDGHNISALEKAFCKAKNVEAGATLIHIQTKKGMGYHPAEQDAVKYHGISPRKKITIVRQSFSHIFTETMLKLMEEDGRIVAITAAMLDGTGLAPVQKKFPNRVFDVGICEQHAVTLAAGMAAQGLIPVVAIYSSFLQRAYDQIINDVCLQRLPVIFAIDRAGIVGDDGKTHQGAFDISYLRCIPNMVVAAPKDGEELQDLFFTAVRSGQTMAIRYPRGSSEGKVKLPMPRLVQIGTGEILRQGNDAALLAIGSMVYKAGMAAELLSAAGIECAVANMRFAKPLDEDLIMELAQRTGRLVTVEENAIAGGFGSAVMELLARKQMSGVRIECIGLDDEFIEHGSQEYIRGRCGLGLDDIVSRIKSSFPERLVNIYEHAMENTG